MAAWHEYKPLETAPSIPAFRSETASVMERVMEQAFPHPSRGRSPGAIQPSLTMPEPSSKTSQVIAFPEPAVCVVDAYLRGLPSEATRQVYAQCIRSFGTFLGDRNFKSASRRDVEAYRAHLEALGRAPATISKHLSALSGLYAFLVDEGEVLKNPVASARRPRLSDTSTRKGITPAETQALLAVCNPTTTIGLRDRALVLTLAVQGWRVSEALGLQVGGLDDEQGHRVATISGKGGKVATVPLAATVWGAMQGWLEAAGISEGAVFVPVLKGGRVQPGCAISAQSAWRRVRFLARRAGISRDLHPHLFRHGAVTEALSRGVPLHQVQDFARHADPRTTRRYDSHRMSLANPTPHVLAAGLTVEGEE